MKVKYEVEEYKSKQTRKEENKMKLGFKKGQKGFTLVELMVVMSIMAVLAAIVVPAVSGTSEVSKDRSLPNSDGTLMRKNPRRPQR